MRIEVRRGADGLTAEWADLAERVGAVPFVRPAWIQAWWRAFGRGSLELATAWRDGDLVGVLPMRRARGAITSPTNWHTPIFGPVVDEGPVAEELFEWLLGRRPRRLALSFIDSDDPALPAFAEAAAARRYRTAVRTRQRSPYLALEGEGDDLDRRLGGKRRRELRRRRRLLEERGEVTFEASDGSEELEEQLGEGFRIEALAWKGERGTAIASRPETQQFYAEIARWAATRGWLRLCFLRLDGRPLAFDLALEHDGRHYLVKTGYDPAYRAHGPGVLLRHEAIARAAGLGLRSYEFLGGAERTKLEWTDTCRERMLAQAFRRSPTGTVDRLVQTHGRRLGARMRARLRR